MKFIIQCPTGVRADFVADKLVRSRFFATTLKNGTDVEIELTSTKRLNLLIEYIPCHISTGGDGRNYLIPDSFGSIFALCTD